MRVYYNEIDAFAAEWLENLIAAGALPAGDVDRRSIADVQAEDLKPYTQCHFFAGIGVWPYALGQAGWPEDRSVWTGSCPCQGFSRAGNKLGFDDPRNLWPQWYRLIRERAPPVVFGEQVTSPLGRTWLDGVSANLEDLDFAVGSADLSAAGVGAPHQRARYFFVGSRMGHAAGVDAERDFGITAAGEEQEKPDRGAGAPDRASAMDGFWSDADLAGCRDGWRRPIEPGTRTLAPRSANNMDVLCALGNAIVAPLAVEFITAFMDTEADVI